ncbi:MAG TPA: hypothetical protein VGR52_09205 [Stellaceae bacterium]|nr:hypothetical protein [Stellaceae bacterium]
MSRLLIAIFICAFVIWQLPGQPLYAATQNSNGASDDQRGTDKFPLTVKIVQTPESDAAAAKVSTQEQSQLDANWWLVRATWVLVGVAIMQLCVFGLQAKRLGQTIKRMDETAEHELRAYISVRPAPLHPVVGPPAAMQNLTPNTQVGVWIQNLNVGKTPAYRVEVRAIVDVLPFPLPHGWQMPQLPAPAVVSRTVIHPQGHSLFAAQSVNPITDFQMTQIQASTHRLYVYGLITYEDAFEENRETRFCASLECTVPGLTFQQAYNGNGMVAALWYGWPEDGNNAT